MKQMYMVVGGAILIGVFMSPASAGLMPIANDSVWRDTVEMRFAHKAGQ